MISEASITRATLQHWRTLGLPDTLVASIPNARAHGQVGLTRGLPDLLVMSPSLPVGFLELKTEKGRLSDAQIVFRELCERLHVPCAVAWGRDEPIAVLERWGVVRASR